MALRSRRAWVVMKNGVITPVASATGNRVYLKPGHLFQLDTRVPDPVDPIDPPPADDYDFVYPRVSAAYTPGQTVVKGTDGKLYACRPFRKAPGATSMQRPTARVPALPGVMLDRVLKAGHRGRRGVASGFQGCRPAAGTTGVRAVAGQRPALPGSWGCRPAAGTSRTYLLLTYFSRRICGLPRPAAFSSSAQASTNVRVAAQVGDVRGRVRRETGQRLLHVTVLHVRMRIGGQFARQARNIAEVRVFFGEAVEKSSLYSSSPGLRAPCSSTICAPRSAMAFSSSGSIERYGVTPVPVAISR